MSRTYRRCGARHEYRWVLREWSFASAGYLAPVMLERHSPEGRRAIARFHSDAQVTLESGPPRWFRRIFEKRHRNANSRQLLRWLANPEYDPMMNARHRHSAKWVWW